TRPRGGGTIERSEGRKRLVDRRADRSIRSVPNRTGAGRKPAQREDIMDRRSFVVGTAAAALAAGAGFAEDFPTHAITIVNPYPPGGANELSTRPFAAAWETVLKKPVVLETKAGAG